MCAHVVFPVRALRQVHWALAEAVLGVSGMQAVQMSQLQMHQDENRF